MRAIERAVEEEPVIKKAKKVENVENSFDKTMADVIIGNEQVRLLDMEEKKETCVASGDGIQNGAVGSIAEEEGKDICVEFESSEVKVEEVSALSLADRSRSKKKKKKKKKKSLADRKNIDPKESRELENEVKEVDVVSVDAANIEKLPLLELERKDEASVPVIENKDACAELEPIEVKIEEVSALSLADRKNIDRKESQDLEKDVKEVDVVSPNVEKLPALELEKKIEASIPLAVTSKDEISLMENKDSCVVSAGIREVNGSTPSVTGKKLLVLDLNGLLADIVSPVANCKADINIGRRAIFRRPFCEDFLKFCFEKFEVGIWSSRKQRNVERITEFLLGDMKNKLLFCWDMSYCATTTVGSLENRHKYVVFKDLNRLWEKHDSKLPWKKGDYNETNTVLLDDSPYKALLNPPYTAIFPHSYTHQNKTDTSLGDGGDLRAHLEKLAEAENVQDFIKKNPFGQEAITEASESWDFYREAIHMLQVTSQTYRF